MKIFMMQYPFVIYGFVAETKTNNWQRFHIPATILAYLMTILVWKLAKIALKLKYAELAKFIDICSSYRQMFDFGRFRKSIWSPRNKDASIGASIFFLSPFQPKLWPFLLPLPLNEKCDFCRNLKNWTPQNTNALLYCQSKYIKIYNTSKILQLTLHFGICRCQTAR